MVSKQPKLAHMMNVVTPWPTADLITLDEFKTALRIPLTDVSKDDELNMIIDGVSSQMAKFANRVFGFDEVQETMYNAVDEDRIFLSQWPVKFSDIKALTLDGVDQLPSHGTVWFLEEKTGTIFWISAPMNGTLFADYSGGYKIPAETPDDLKRAAQVAMREDYYMYVRGSLLSGVRAIMHKHARVMYYPPGQLAATQTSGSSLGPVWQSVQNVLNKYIRYWV